MVNGDREKDEETRKREGGYKIKRQNNKMYVSHNLHNPINQHI